MEVYKNSFEYISDEFSRLDILIQIQKHRLKDTTKNDKFRGLFISEQEINSLFQNIDPNSLPEEEDADIEDLKAPLAKVEENINSKKLNSLKNNVYLSLPHLSKLFGLTKFEEEVIIICLAPELDKKYEKLYSYLNDDITQKNPTLDLILNLTCKNKEEKMLARSFLSKQATLFKENILQIIDDEQNKTTFPSSSVKLDERIVNFLLEMSVGEPSIETFSKLHTSNKSIKHIVMDKITTSLNPIITRYLDGKSSSEKLLINFYGPKGCGKKSTAQSLCVNHNFPLLSIDLKEIVRQDLPFESSLRKSFREALLKGAALYLDNLDAISENNEKQISINSVIKMIQDFPWIVFASTEIPWNSEGLIENSLFLPIKFSKPNYPERKRIWENIVKLTTDVSFEPKIDFSMLANKFSFTQNQIIDAINYAKNLALSRDNNDPKITLDDLYESCKSLSSKDLAVLAKKIEPHYTWKDIVLPNRTIRILEDLCNHVKNKQLVYHDWGFDKKFSLGKGLIVLFKGETGTGKTMASEVIANELNLDMYKIDLSGVVSKYIGETEKNLNKIFSHAESSNAILFFDEADALFGKRSEVKDAHDRYANVETNYLLQKIDEYDGIVILATNFQKNIDTAFTRRMNFIVDFPFPESKHRLQIWQNSFPKETKIEKDVDFKFLTNNIKLSGGNIKNIVVNSAFIAAENSQSISMENIIQAIKQEYQKMGKPIVKGEFGKYSELLEQ